MKITLKYENGLWFVGDGEYDGSYATLESALAQIKNWAETAQAVADDRISTPFGAPRD